MNYFECNLPLSASHIIVPESRREYQKVSAAIHERSEKLNEALEICGYITGETFAKYAKLLFDQNPQHFDDFLAPQTIADFVMAMWDGSEEPERMEWPNAVPLFDTRFTTTAEWEALRNIGIGGSESATIQNCSPWSNQRQLFHRKVGTKNTVSEKKSVFERGHFIEHNVIEAFCEAHGAKRIPEYRMFQSRQYPNCTANIDAIVDFPGDELHPAGIYVFEAKTTAESNYAHWSNDRVPGNYEVQCHHYPAVLGDDRVLGTFIECFFVVDYEEVHPNGNWFLGATYTGERQVTRFIPRDADYEQQIMEDDEAFWNSYIAPGILPPYQNDPSTSEQVRNQLYGSPDINAPVITLSSKTSRTKLDAYFEADRKHQEAKAVAAKYDAEKKNIAAEIQFELAGAGKAVVDIDGTECYEITSKGKTSRGINKDSLKILEAKYPSLIGPYITTTACSPIFSVKKTTYDAMARAARK